MMSSPVLPERADKHMERRSFDVDTAEEDVVRQTSRGTSRRSTSVWRSESGAEISKWTQTTRTEMGVVSEPTTSHMVRRESIRSRFRMSCLTDLREEELRHILSVVESEAAQRHVQSINYKVHSCCMGWAVRTAARAMDQKTMEAVMNSVVGFIIFANTVCLGLSLDIAKGNERTFLVLDIIFSILFMIELIVKLCAFGCHELYCGKDSMMNLFDTSIVIIDSIQLVVMCTLKDSPFGPSGNYAGVLRVVRLLRLSRILRLLRSRVFRDLLAMIEGIRGGMTALGWSLVLFGLFVFVVSLVFREGLGNNEEIGEEIGENVAAFYFRTVPRSMFTIFRCSFGDCSTISGTPIFEHVTNSHGVFWSFAYSLFLFLVVIGMFNVISAIFVENTMSFAMELTTKKRRMALHDDVRWAQNVMTVLQAMVNKVDPDLPGLQELVDTGKCSDELFNHILETQITRKDLHIVLHEDVGVQKALEKLDINPCDHRYLPDILDPHNRGFIGVLEFVDGIKRLRGDPRRSDIIAVDLMVRSLHSKSDNILRWLEVTAKTVRKKTTPSVTSTKAVSSQDTVCM